MLSFVNGYFEEDDRTLVMLRRDERGELVEQRFPGEHVAYFQDALDDRGLEKRLSKSAHVRSVKWEGPWLRVGFVNGIARNDLLGHPRSPLVQEGIDSFEGDVPPLMRWMVDQNAGIQPPRRCYLDIETDSRVPVSKKEQMRLLTWAVTDDEGRVQAGVLAEDTDAAERALLDELWRALAPYDQVSAWYGDGFDFPVIFARSSARGCKVDARRWLWVDHLALFRRMNLNASESGDEKQSMKLQAIGMAVLGEGKDDFDARHTYEEWAAGGERRAYLLRYNVQDVELLRRIEAETGYLALFQSLCEACHVFGDSWGLNPTRQMDGFMLRLGMERGMHFPTKHYREGLGKFKGAFVMEPRCKGVTRDVHVCDFASLYPSIMLTWNMSPETKVTGAPVNGPIATGHCRSPLTGITFDTTTFGILSFALSEFIRLRKYWNDKKSEYAPGTPEWQDANRKSTAYKVAANSFYGVVGSPFSRYFDRQIAESVTQNGVWLIEKTIEAAEARGWQAVYGDTDSVFVTGPSRAEFAAFAEWCNKELYPGLLKTVGCVNNHIKLAYEKQFARFVIVTAKRYIASFVHYKGKDANADSKPEIKGLEYKRGDASKLARMLQAHVIDMLVGGLKIDGGEVPTDDIGRYHEVVSKVRSHVLTDPLPMEEVVLSKSLSKPLREYVAKVKIDGTPAAQPAHVAVAKVLEARGQDVSEGTRIEYVVVDGAASPAKTIPAEDYTGVEADRYYVWESLVWPPTERLLQAAYPDHDWATWGKVRPPKPRTRATKVLPGQMPLLGVDTARTAMVFTMPPQPRGMK